MLKVISDKNKSMREKSVPVELPLSEEDRNFALSLLDYLKKSQDEEYAKKHNIRAGVGLAAPQVAVNKRIIAIYYQIEENKYMQLVLANPKIISNSIRKAYLESGEGCLSVNEEHKGHAIRDYKIVVKAFDVLNNNEISISARGFDAIVLQHEIDHLDGKFFYDHIDPKDPFKTIDGAFVI